MHSPEQHCILCRLQIGSWSWLALVGACSIVFICRKKGIRIAQNGYSENPPSVRNDFGSHQKSQAYKVVDTGLFVTVPP